MTESQFTAVFELADGSFVEWQVVVELTMGSAFINICSLEGLCQMCSKFCPKISLNFHLLCSFSVPIMLTLCTYISYCNCTFNQWIFFRRSDCFIREYRSMRLYTIHSSTQMQFTFTSDCSVREYQSIFKDLSITLWNVYLIC